MNYKKIRFFILKTIIYAIVCIILTNHSIIYRFSIKINNIHKHNNFNTDLIINTLIKILLILFSFKSIYINSQSNNINKLMYSTLVTMYTNNPNNQMIYDQNYGNIQNKNYIGDVYAVEQRDALFYKARILNDNYYNLVEPFKPIKFLNFKVVGWINAVNNFIHSKSVIINYILNLYTDNYITNKQILYTNNHNFSKISLKLIELSMSSIASSSVVSNTNYDNIIDKWICPSKGKVISFLPDSQSENKGIEIIGLRGQPIFATAAGKVVYSGNGVHGYGNLIIIRHNDNYLSVYAHNETILVCDHEVVQAGQKIATMGNTGTDSVKLHFAIYYKGKSVNPLYYISER